MNHLAATTSNPDAINQVFNTAVGERSTLNQLTLLIRQYLSEFDPRIADIPILYGPDRKGDIPHSLASVEKARRLLNYEPTHTLSQGLKEVVRYYWGITH